ncbi:hypothetical protein ACQ4PT_009995 [Festuca glaucescens]
MELEKCFVPGSLPFTEKDARNLIHSFRRFDQEEENVDLLKMCRIFKEKDPNFKYDFTRDAHNRLENIAWSYASSIQSYKVFGDALVYDTSHRLNALDTSLGIWIGMNNHGMPFLFGCMLLREENLQSFTWALQVALVVDYKDQAGEQQTMQQNLQNASFKTATPMEGHAAAILTPYAFSKLQDELVAAAHYASFQLEGDVFLVRHHTKTEGGCIVTWNQREELISCSCQMFESSGILCRHTLRVLTTLNYFQIPDHYLPVRWHKNLPPPSKSLHVAPNLSGASERVKTLQSIVSALVSEAAKSDERMDLATHEVSALLSRVRQQPVSVNVSGDSAHSSLAAVAKHCVCAENVNISK